MKRRRWVLFALSLALLAACVGVWKWSERPPYKFMEGARLYFVEKNARSSSGEYVTTYVMAAPPNQVGSAAAAELGPPIAEVRNFTFQFRGVVVLSTAWAKMDLPFVDPRKKENWPPLAKSDNTFVCILRPPSVLDRLRGWLYSLSWKGRGT